MDKNYQGNPDKTGRAGGSKEGGRLGLMSKFDFSINVILVTFLHRFVTNNRGIMPPLLASPQRRSSKKHGKL
jgi:hypothetical protein